MNLGRDLIEIAPLLLPSDLEGLSYAGFITSGVSNLSHHLLMYIYYNTLPYCNEHS